MVLVETKAMIRMLKVKIQIQINKHTKSLKNTEKLVRTVGGSRGKRLKGMLRRPVDPPHTALEAQPSRHL